MTLGPLGLWLGEGTREITQLRFAWQPEPWLVFLVAALLCAFAGLAYLLEPKRERRWVKVPLWGIRVALLCLTAALLLRPVQSQEQVEVKDGQVVVALDTSRSMAFQDREKDEDLRAAIAEALELNPQALRDLDRLSRVKLALRKDQGAFLQGLVENNGLRLYRFDSGRQRLDTIEKGGGEEGEAGVGSVAEALGEIEGLSADGQSTALGDSLQRIFSDLRSERVAAVVVLSDGCSNAGSLAAEAVATRFGRKGVPVYTVGVGDPEPPRDLAVDDFRAPDVSLAGDLLRGSLLVRAKGYTELQDVRVRVLLDGVPVDLGPTGGVRPMGGEVEEWQVEFSAKVDRPGEYTLEAIVEADPDELTSDNNRAVRRVRVIDEQIRVLYVEGYPRWEYRYLKNALVRDRHMQVQCLLLSADPGYVQESSPGVPPLEALPPLEQLREYHVIVLGDVSPEERDRWGRPVFYDGAMEGIRDLVREDGGGLLMVSGARHAPRSYAGTPIADVLPVEISESTAGPRTFREAFRPELTREGRQSPLMRLEASERLNLDLWTARLPGMYWYTRAERAKPQARVLATHPRDRNQHGAFPLIAWHRYGAGTSIWMGVDETWLWRNNVGDKYQYRFFGQMIRFLSLQSFTRSKRFFVTTDKTQYDVGEEVRIRAEIRDRDDLVEQEAQEVLLDLPTGDQETLTLSALEGEPGTFEGTFKPVQVGGYRLHMDPGDRGSLEEVASRLFEVRLPRLELQDPRMDEETLRAVAAASGGRFLRLHELASLPEEIEPLEERVRVGKSEEDLWDRWPMLAAFLVLLVLEWIGRKAVRLQ